MQAFVSAADRSWLTAATAFLFSLWVDKVRISSTRCCPKLWEPPKSNRTNGFLNWFPVVKVQCWNAEGADCFPRPLPQQRWSLKNRAACKLSIISIQCEMLSIQVKQKARIHPHGSDAAYSSLCLDILRIWICLISITGCLEVVWMLLLISNFCLLYYMSKKTSSSVVSSLGSTYNSNSFTSKNFFVEIPVEAYSNLESFPRLCNGGNHQFENRLSFSRELSLYWTVSVNATKVHVSRFSNLGWKHVSTGRRLVFLNHWL